MYKIIIRAKFFACGRSFDQLVGVEETIELATQKWECVCKDFPHHVVEVEKGA